MHTIKNWFAYEAVNIISRATLPNLECKSSSVAKLVTASHRIAFQKYFSSSTAPFDDSASHTCNCLWRNSLNALNYITPNMKITAVERLTDGAHLKWTNWKSLNHLRSQIGCCKTNMVKCNHTTGPDTCDCSEQQTIQHLLVYPHLPSPVTADDLAEANHIVLQCAIHWKNSI